ncbi:hypothetical protein [Bdellovibrio sp. BCCA]|uniref:hypothetical protein n=1 Tax=Bdellovibrio sp. BCCA TaxID=3136281 RepID=UPI0030F17A0B
MKKLAVILALSLAGVFAHAESADSQVQGDVSINGRAWACGLAFKGTSKGLKVIVGHFSTVAYGTLTCKGLLNKHYSQNVKITIGHHWLGPTVGAGYFKLAGVSSEISLFNSSPSVILGKYKVAQGEAAIIGGVGAFTAVKVGLPQLAFNISLQLLKGVGVQVGIDKLRIEAVD